MSDITVTLSGGNQISVATGVVVGPLPELQLAAGAGVTITNSGGVSTISANLPELSIPANLADLADVSAVAASGQVLSYNGTEWGGLTLSIPANLADLSNVNGTPTTGQALIWSGSEWAGGNIPPGTTVNGLSGDVTLLAGGNINLSTEGQNITIESVGGGGSVNGLTGNITISTLEPLELESDGEGELIMSLPESAPGEPLLWQSLDSSVVVGWESNRIAPPAGGYVVEILEVSNISAPSGGFVSIDGINVTVNLTTDFAADAIRLAFLPSGDQLDTAATGFDLETPISFAGVGWSAPNASISLLGLPYTIPSPGGVDVYAQPLYATGDVGNFTLIGNATASQHGEPVPPEIVDAYETSTDEAPFNSTGLTILLDVEASPHMRGFYDYSNITYTISASQDGEGNWATIASNSSVQNGGLVELTSNQTSLGGYYLRSQATNPQGSGSYSYGRARGL